MFEVLYVDIVWSSRVVVLAAWTCSAVMCICVGCSLSIFLVIFLFVVLVL